MKTTRRGYLPEYEKYFNKENIELIKDAMVEVNFLENRGYKVKAATTFVQQHYAFTEEQRLILARCASSDKAIKERKAKAVKKLELKGKTVYIDGFNAIIPMESLVSDSPVFKCMDGAVRDLANLRGSYKIIDKTEPAINLLLKQLDKRKVKKAVIYLDKPISNSGRLKMLILEVAKNYKVEVEVELLNAVDKELYYKENVISGDCVVIDYSTSWVPLYGWIIEDYMKDHNVWLVDFSKLKTK